MIDQFFWEIGDLHATCDAKPRGALRITLQLQLIRFSVLLRPKHNAHIFLQLYRYHAKGYNGSTRLSTLAHLELTHS